MDCKSHSVSGTAIEQNRIGIPDSETAEILLEWAFYNLHPTVHGILVERDDI